MLIYHLMAYLDPGAGSYLIQFLFAGLLGLAFSVKLYWKKITGFFSSRSQKADKNDTFDA